MDAKTILKNLIQFNTVKDKENKEILNYIEKILKAKGFETEYKSKCLIMHIKDRHSLGFLGHTDTVTANPFWDTDPFKMEEINGKLYGLGVCDMKGSIAAILQAVSEIDWEKEENGIKLYFTYDEEIGFSGVKELIQKKEKFPEYMIIGEPSNNSIKNASKGLLECKLTFSGKSAHSSMPNKGENAIEKCMRCLNVWYSFYETLKKDVNNHFEIPYTTMNIGKIDGGTDVNIVPNTCSVWMDFRVIKKEHIKKIYTKLEEMAGKYQGNVSILNCIDPLENVGEISNPTNFITEASFIDAKKKHILGVGPVNPHETNEYITTQSLDRLVEQYKEIIDKQIQLSKMEKSYKK